MPTPGVLSIASCNTFALLALAITVRTPDHEAMRAAESFDAIPPLPRAVPADPAFTVSNGSSAPTCSTSVAEVSVRGSAVYKPPMSVSNTSASAPTLCATSAAMRSLSPKRISSLAMASFSLMIGTQPSSSKRPRVWRACKYCVRSMKSFGTSNTCAPISPRADKYSL